MGVFGATGSQRLGRVGRGRGESGGAISLWVLLMVPVSGFAAVVAMAGPQRVSAESTMQDAADDLAMLAVAWRDGQGINPDDMQAGPLHAFPPECSNDAQPTHYDPRIEFHESEVEKYQAQIDGLPSGDPLIPGLQLAAFTKPLMPQGMARVRVDVPKLVIQLKMVVRIAPSITHRRSP